MKLYPIVKRGTDLALSVLLAIVLSPVMALCAAMIWVEDPTGPILYKPMRVGKLGVPFAVLKFRTMRVETVRDGKRLDDSERLLRFGRIMRSSSLDELPQLLNVIVGAMSFIGPRPLPVKYLPYFTDTEMHRHDVRPGISGLAQINGRNNLDWEERFAMDLEYVRKYSLAMDAAILAKTVVKIISRSDIVIRGENGILDFHEYRMRQTSTYQSPTETTTGIPKTQS